MEDEAKYNHPPLEYADARILACLSHEPFSSICSIAQALDLAPATVHQHLIISLNMQPDTSDGSPMC
jgi:DNA-binding transcriptional ArsR family regulator